MPATTPLFLDCEFTGLVKNAALISLCLYRDESSYFYAELTNYDPHTLNSWLQENVTGKLLYNDRREVLPAASSLISMKGSPEQVVQQLRHWLQQFEMIEVWGDVPAYDWMLFCDLFGGALQLPKNIFYIPFDLATLAKAKNMDPDFSRFDYAGMSKEKQHNALEDCRTEKTC